jgi:glc operon protein GlcG
MPDFTARRSTLRFWALVVTLACAGRAAAQEAEKKAGQAQAFFGQNRAVSQIRDRVGLYDAAERSKVQQALEQIEEKYGVPTIVEVADTLEGNSAQDVARDRAPRLLDDGIYLLITVRDRQIAEPVLVGRAANRLSASDRASIRRTIVDNFNDGKISDGLARGIIEIAERLEATRGAAASTPAGGRSAATTATGPGDGGGLVLRGQSRLTLRGAQAIVAEAVANATELGVNINVAVVDEGGHLLAFARMDGARPASGYTAITKATTAATFRQASGPIGPSGGPPDLLLNLSVQNAAAASGGKVTTLLGGVPIILDEQVIGAVGVGGAASGEQDVEIAKAGLRAFASSLQQAAAASSRPSDPIFQDRARPAAPVRLPANPLGDPDRAPIRRP